MNIGYALLLLLVLGIFLFCYFIITAVWIKVDQNNVKDDKDDDGTKNKRRDFLYLSSISDLNGTAVFLEAISALSGDSFVLHAIIMKM